MPAQSSPTRNSSIADKLDFRLKDDSPALKLGFKPFDYTKAGVYGDAEWIKLANSVVYPPFAPPPKAPPAAPFTFTDDFESTPVGGKPLAASVHVEGKGDSIAVTEETAASGKHSLKITDAPNLTAPWDPHFYYRPAHADGVTTFSFDIRVEPRTIMYHEWRDNASRYNVGPTFHIRDLKLFIAGQKPIDLPDARWIHIEIAAALGPASTGTWSIAVTLPNEPPRKFDGLKCSANWKELQWLGFSSTATDKAVYYLDNLVLKNSLDR